MKRMFANVVPESQRAHMALPLSNLGQPENMGAKSDD